MNVTHLKTAISYLEEHTDWLETEELKHETSPERQADVSHVTQKEGRKEGIEGRKEGAHASDFAEIPSWEEWWKYCQSQGLIAEWYARDKFLAAEAEHWERKTAWRKHADRCRAWWEGDGRPMAPRNSGQPPKAKRKMWQP